MKRAKERGTAKLRKATQVASAALHEVASNQSGPLWYSLVPSLNRQFLNGSDSEEDDVDDELMDALSECYSNASSWGIRRQKLSIMADKVTFRTLNKWIPGLTRYLFSAARKHTMLHGRGVPVKQSRQTRLHVSPKRVDHFLDFITSRHACYQGNTIRGEIHQVVNK